MTADTLSLYFELRPGEKADLEVAAAAALAWAEGVKAAARVLDPDAEVRIELIDATESSLGINTVLKWLEKNIEPHLERIERGGHRLPRTRKLAIGLAVMLVVTGPQTWDFYFGGEPFTAEDREALNTILEQTRSDPDVKAARKKFYKTIERDPAISGVGIKERPKDAPVALVPSNQFAEGGGLWEAEELVEARTTYHVLEVVLVKPALVHTPRAWTFRIDGLPEFEAVMRDETVLAAIKEGGLPGLMREGITMKVRLQVKEVFVDGEWRVVRGGRSIVRVLEPGGF